MPSLGGRSFASLIPRSRRSRIVVALLIAGLVGGIVGVLSGGGALPPKTPATVPAVPTSYCPLTDTPAPNGSVPNRPAIAVKIGNEPGGARPQSGLNEADVVFDTPAEGFIMRYVAVYQCHAASSIGPTRSLRWVDWHLADELGHPILAFAGGIDPDVNTVMGLSWLTPANLLEGAQAAAHRIPGRQPPDNLYTSTAAIYKMFPNLTGAPSPIFSFSKKIPRNGKKIAAFHINFSAGTDVVWKWDAKKGVFVHTYSGAVDRDAATGRPVTATNIAVVSASYTFGPYAENPGGSGDVESQVVGHGPGYVLRNGEAIGVTWSRPTGTDPMVFKDEAGHVVSMEPGRTWVEIVPDTTFASSSVSLVPAS